MGRTATWERRRAPRGKEELYAAEVVAWRWEQSTRDLSVSVYFLVERRVD